jgi:hypothetical protein
MISSVHAAIGLPSCYYFTHCGKQVGGAQLSTFWTVVRLVLVSVLLLGIFLLQRRLESGGGNGWWRRRADPPPDDPPPSFDGAARKNPDGPDRSHRRRPRPVSLNQKDTRRFRHPSVFDTD